MIELLLLQQQKCNFSKSCCNDFRYSYVPKDNFTSFRNQRSNAKDSERSRVTAKSCINTFPTKQTSRRLRSHCEKQEKLSSRHINRSIKIATITTSAQESHYKYKILLVLRKATISISAQERHY